MADCIFCKIAKGDIPCAKLYEDESILAFKDINPAAPFHALIIPKLHVATLNDISGEHEALIGRMHSVARDIAKKNGIDASGYRTVMNCNRDAGQVVFHLHMHILGGRPLGIMG